MGARGKDFHAEKFTIGMSLLFRRFPDSRCIRYVVWPDVRSDITMVYRPRLLLPGQPGELMISALSEGMVAAFVPQYLMGLFSGQEFLTRAVATPSLEGGCVATFTALPEGVNRSASDSRYLHRCVR